MRKPTPLVYNGEIINARDEMLSLTDMWRAAGSPEMKRPGRWLELDSTRDFVECVGAAQNIGSDDIIRAERGRNGGTFAHWQIAMAYAKALNPAFHMWCNTVVRERMEGRSIEPGAGVIGERRAHDVEP